MPQSPTIWIAVGVMALVMLIVISILAQFFTIWLQALLSNARVGLVDLIAMRLRKVDVRTVVLSRIRAVIADIPLTTVQIETHFLAGGNVPNVVSALIAAKKAKFDLTWEDATRDDLNGRDVLADVKELFQHQRRPADLLEVLGRLEGQSGLAGSDLAPSGVVRVGDLSMEALADEDGISRGEQVIVTGVVLTVRRAM